MRIIRMLVASTAGGAGAALAIALRNTIVYAICIFVGCIVIGVILGFYVSVSLCRPTQEKCGLVIWALASAVLALGVGGGAYYWSSVQWIAASAGGVALGFACCSAVLEFCCEKR